jgi:hypothetical protein
MSTYKNVSDDYTITCNNGVGIFTVNAANTVINGNLTYTGNLTTVDDFIVVAANNTGTITDMGLLAQTGNTTFAGLRYDTANAAWQVSSSVYGNGSANSQAYVNLATSVTSSVAGANTQLQFNQASAFGASANLTFDYAANKLTLQGYEVFGNIGTTPAYTGNGVAVYNNVPGGGGTGLYVKNTVVNDELVSKSKAIVYSIIF